MLWSVYLSINCQSDCQASYQAIINLFINLHINLLINLSISLFFNLFVNQFINIVVNQFINIFINLSFVCKFVSLSVNQLINRFVSPFANLCVNSFAYLLVNLFIMALIACHCICLSVCSSIYHAFANPSGCISSANSPQKLRGRYNASARQRYLTRNDTAHSNCYPTDILNTNTTCTQTFSTPLPTCTKTNESSVAEHMIKTKVSDPTNSPACSKGMAKQRSPGSRCSGSTPARTRGGLTTGGLI